MRERHRLQLLIAIVAINAAPCLFVQSVLVVSRVQAWGDDTQRPFSFPISRNQSNLSLVPQVPTNLINGNTFATGLGQPVVEGESDTNFPSPDLTSFPLHEAYHKVTSDLNEVPQANGPVHGYKEFDALELRGIPMRDASVESSSNLRSNTTSVDAVTGGCRSAFSDESNVSRGEIHQPVEMGTRRDTDDELMLRVRKRVASVSSDSSSSGSMEEPIPYVKDHANENDRRNLFDSRMYRYVEPHQWRHMQQQEMLSATQNVAKANRRPVRVVCENILSTVNLRDNTRKSGITRNWNYVTINESLYTSEVDEAEPQSYEESVSEHPIDFDSLHRRYNGMSASTLETLRVTAKSLRLFKIQGAEKVIQVLSKIAEAAADFFGLKGRYRTSSVIHNRFDERNPINRLIQLCGCDIEPPQGRTLLMKLIKDQQIETIWTEFGRLLWDATLLHDAVYFHAVSPVTVTDSKGNNLFHYAAMSGTETILLSVLWKPKPRHALRMLEMANDYGLRPVDVAAKNCWIQGDIKSIYRQLTQYLQREAATATGPLE